MYNNNNTPFANYYYFNNNSPNHVHNNQNNQNNIFNNQNLYSFQSSYAFNNNQTSKHRDYSLLYQQKSHHNLESRLNDRTPLYNLYYKHDSPILNKINNNIIEQGIHVLSLDPIKKFNSEEMRKNEFLKSCFNQEEALLKIKNEKDTSNHLCEILSSKILDLPEFIKTQKGSR